MFAFIVHLLCSALRMKPKSPTEDQTLQHEEEAVHSQKDEEGEAVGWSTWFTSTVSSAKEKSSEMFQYLKQDLSEFGGTVQEAGKDLKDKLNLEDTAKSAVTHMGNTVNVLLEQVSTIFGVGPDDDDEAICIGKSGSIVMDRVQVRIPWHDILKSQLNLIQLGRSVVFFVPSNCVFFLHSG